MHTVRKIHYCFLEHLGIWNVSEILLPGNWSNCALCSTTFYGARSKNKCKAWTWGALEHNTGAKRRKTQQSATYRKQSSSAKRGKTKLERQAWENIARAPSAKNTAWAPSEKNTAWAPSTGNTVERQVWGNTARAPSTEKLSTSVKRRKT